MKQIGCKARRIGRLSPRVKLFIEALPDILGGKHPRLWPWERQWLKVFNTTATEFKTTFTRDESFYLSAVALARCDERGANSYKYLRTAAKWEHLKDHDRLYQDRKRARAKRKLQRRVGQKRVNPWQAVDIRLDIVDAMEKLKQRNARWAKVVRLWMERYSFTEIGDDLGISSRQVQNLFCQACEHLRRLLGREYAEKYEGGKTRKDFHFPLPVFG